MGIAVSLSVIELFYRVARPHDAVLGTVPDLAGLHDIDDWAGATTIPRLLIYRYDAPLCFANAENFKQRVLEAIEAEKNLNDYYRTFLNIKQYPVITLKAKPYGVYLDRAI